jgi:hypothetical protein
MTPLTTMRRALSDPVLLGRVMQADSWSSWKVLLIAAAGEPLTDEERVEFKRLTGREHEPGQLVREFIAIFGRRGGKTFAMAVFLAWIAALCDHRGSLAPGEIGVALLISRDQRVAKIILNYIEGILSQSEQLGQLIVSRTQETIELSNGISVEVRPANYRTLRGPTYICVIGDEAAQWFTSVDFANPDVEILAAVKPGLMTTRGPLLLARGAPWIAAAVSEAAGIWSGPQVGGGVSELGAHSHRDAIFDMAARVEGFSCGYTGVAAIILVLVGHGLLPWVRQNRELLDRLYAERDAETSNMWRNNK